MSKDLFPESASEADLIRTQIRIENEYTPLEIAELLDSQHPLPDTISARMGELTKHMGDGSETPRKYQRKAISENVFLYESQKCKASYSDKALLVCFCGNWQRLMMPISLFLQFVPEEQFDVLLMRDPQKLNYLNGIPGYSDTLAGCVERLQQDLNLENNYTWLSCYGTSGGGAAALYAGSYLEASRAVSVGGRHPSTTQRLAESLIKLGHSESQVWALDEMVSGKPSSAETELLTVFGAGCTSDRAGAVGLQKRLPRCKLIAIDGINNHSIVGRLLKKHEFQGFLNRFVLSAPR